MNVTSIKLLLFVLAFGVSAFAQEKVFTHIKPVTETKKDEKRIELLINPSISGNNFANELGERVQAASFGLNINFNYKLSSILDVTTSTRASMMAGQSLTRFGEGAPSNGIFLNEALVNFRPSNYTSIHAGAINQSYLGSPLLVSDTAFPGIQEKIFFKSEKFSLSLVAEQTVPTSNTLSTKTSDREESPNFLTETIKLETQLIKQISFDVFGTLYHFSNLPSKVAADSAVLGNSQPEQAGPNTSRFTYDFNGWVAGAATRITIAPEVKLIFTGSAIENSQAPESTNHGQLISFATELALGKDLVLTPSVENFFNESDTSPAYYNSYVYGHNNRQGFAGGLVLDFPQSKFKISTKYVVSDVINETYNQGKQQYLSIKLETSYDVL